MNISPPSSLQDAWSIALLVLFSIISNDAGAVWCLRMEPACFETQRRLPPTDPSQSHSFTVLSDIASGII